MKSLTSAEEGINQGYIISGVGLFIYVLCLLTSDYVRLLLFLFHVSADADLCLLLDSWLAKFGLDKLQRHVASPLNIIPHANYISVLFSINRLDN